MKVHMHTLFSGNFRKPVNKRRNSRRSAEYHLPGRHSWGKTPGHLKYFFGEGKAAQAIRKGLIFMTPLVILSSMALVLLNFPVSTYQNWLYSIHARPYLSVLNLIYDATIDYFSLILSFAVAWCYAEQLQIKNGKSFVSFGATASFLILINAPYGDFNTLYLSTAGISSSLLASLITTRLFYQLSSFRFFRSRDEDMDSFLGKMTASILPLACILIAFAVATYVIEASTGTCLQELIEDFFTFIFTKIQFHRLFTGIYYVLTLHLLWFFGIQGSHIYYEINEVFLANYLRNNIMDAAMGNQPAEIINTVFINSVSDIGGAGSTLALVLAILLVSRNKNTRRVAKFGLLPSFMNVNEIILFGLPIVFNPVFFIPFLIAPFVNLCIGYLATSIGLIPVVIQDINWTTPPVLSGFLATGSLRGAVLQVLLLAIDVGIYIPFVRKMDKKTLPIPDLYEDNFEKIKTMEEKDIENRRLIYSLTNVFSDVYELDIESEMLRVIRSSRKDPLFSGGQEIRFQAFWKYFIQKMPADKRMEQENMLELGHLSAYILEAKIMEREFQLMEDDGQHWFRMQVILSYARRNRPPIVTITIMNIDDLKLLQAEQNMALLAAYESARRANQAKSDFLSNMSHDIRTPMNAVIGMSTIARRYIHDPERLLDCLDKIDSSSAHLLNLINSVLDMSKIESRKLTLAEQSFPLDGMLGDIIVIIQPQAQKKQINFIFGFENIAGITVIGDSLRIRQVLLNILGNAVKFTPEKGTITFTGVRRPSSYEGYSTFEFICSDTGIGMSSEFIDKLFKPFERASDSAVNKIEGSGLGMSITKSIIEMMNGEIYVESEKNQGSKFTVILHLKEAARQAVPKEPVQSPASGGDLEGRRVLLVEDNDLNREIACEFLKPCKVEIETAVNGREAVELMSSSPPGYYNLIFMDIQMPKMNGYEAAAAIRKMDRPDCNIPIVAMTANAFSDDIRNAMEAGLNEHVSKPVSADRLTEVLKKWLPADKE